jgi:hypothetical protein
MTAQRPEQQPGREQAAAAEAEQVPAPAPEAFTIREAVKSDSMNSTQPLQISTAGLGDEIAKALESKQTKVQPVAIVSDPPHRIISQFDYYAIKGTNTLEFPFLHRTGINFNKLWVYPGIRNGISGASILTVNAGTVYIGERGDGPDQCVDILAPGDLPFKIELPQGMEKSLSELCVYGTAGDGIWVKYWMLK